MLGVNSNSTRCAPSTSHPTDDRQESVAIHARCRGHLRARRGSISHPPASTRAIRSPRSPSFHRICHAPLREIILFIFKQTVGRTRSWRTILFHFGGIIQQNFHAHSVDDSHRITVDFSKVIPLGTADQMETGSVLRSGRLLS